MSFACFVFSIGKNLSYISLGTGPFALGTPPFNRGADSVEKPLFPVFTLNIDHKFLSCVKMLYTNRFIIIASGNKKKENDFCNLFCLKCPFFFYLKIVPLFFPIQKPQEATVINNNKYKTNFIKAIYNYNTKSWVFNISYFIIIFNISFHFNGKKTLQILMALHLFVHILRNLHTIDAGAYLVLHS